MTLRESTDDLVPQCERCWIEDNSVWELDSVDEVGNIITKLISVSVPVDLSPGSVAECYSCGRVTVAGIYVPVDELYKNAEEEIEQTLPEEPE